MDEAAVLAECAANPDEDAPRLVWADLVGGERGELVVIQCDLARGDLSPAEAAVRRKRERALLERHGPTWAGRLEEVATTWSFRRGFIEAARLFAHDDEALAAHPLLASIAVDYATLLPAIVARRTVRGLSWPGGNLARLAESPALQTLRAFGIDGLDASDWLDLRALLPRMQLALLRLAPTRVRPMLFRAEVELLVERTAADRLSLQSGDRREPVRIERPIRALETNAVDLDVLAASSRETLEHLHVVTYPNQVERLLAFGRLERLVLAGDPDDALRTLANASPLPRLRRVRLEVGADPAVLHAFVARYGEQLELLEIAQGSPFPDGAVAGELRAAPERYELLHHDRDAFLALGAPRSGHMHQAALARLTPKRATWDLTTKPLEERIFLGRSPKGAVRTNHASLSRRQCELSWRHDRHVAVDTASTNGISTGGERVQQIELADGSDLVAGDVRFRYFVGPGAYDRAMAAVAEEPA